MVRVGLVVRAHGVRGALRVRAESDALATLERVHAGGREYRVLRASPDKEDFLVELEGVRDRSTAEAMRGVALEVPREELPPVEPGEHYVADLVGCRVYDAAGALLGEVASSFPAGPYEMLEVKGPRDFMLPFTAPIVTYVDVAARRIVCDPPPGLIDLDEAES
jgi:16S rRNA processing protein RimM